MKRPPIKIEALPPERRRRSSVTLYTCCCTCCCCCCLHTVGGLIGAAVAPSFGASSRPKFGPAERMARAMPGMPFYYYEEDEFEGEVRVRPRISAVALFWWLLLAMSGIGLILSLRGISSSGGESAIVGLIVLALGMPGLQLVSALITFIVLLCSKRPDRHYQLKQLGKISLGVVIGTVAGLLVMVALAAAFGVFK